MLAKRMMTAIIGIPVAAAIIYYGQWLFAVAIMILAVGSWHELHMMLRHKGIKADYVIPMTAILLLQGCTWLGNSEETVAVLMVSVTALLAMMVLRYTRFNAYDAAFSLFGIVYVGLSFATLLALRFLPAGHYMTDIGMPIGVLYVAILFAGTWANDTCAYFVGCNFGKRKLCPSLSPGKTIEGACGGLAGSVAATLAVCGAAGIPVSYSLPLGVLLGVTAPLGDLVESALKRFCGVKDSGKLLPGHGGMLDRFDSIMFAAPLVYYYIRIIF